LPSSANLNALASSSSPTVTSSAGLVAILEDYLQIAPEGSPLRTPAANAALTTHFERVTFRPGNVLLEAGAASERLFLIERGTVDLIMDLSLVSKGQNGSERGLTSPTSSDITGGTSNSRSRNGNSTSGEVVAAAAAAAAAKGAALTSQRSRLQRISGGGICGELGFFLETPQSFNAVAIRPTIAWTLSRKQFADMQIADAQLCILVQMALVKSLALSSSQNLEGTRHRHLSSGGL
jgi:CRP-like cAMP-binding protein